MATLRENADIIRSQSRQFRAIIEMADQLGEVEQIERTQSAAQDQLKKVERQVAVARSDLANIFAEAAKVKNETDKVKIDAAAEAASIIAEAEAKAKLVANSASGEKEKLNNTLLDLKAEEVKRIHIIADLDRQIGERKAEFLAMQSKLAASFDSLKSAMTG